MKQNLPEGWRLIIVARQYVTFDRFAMLGDTLTTFKATAERLLAADWSDARSECQREDQGTPAQVYGTMLCMAYAMIFQIKGAAAGYRVNNDRDLQ